MRTMSFAGTVESRSRGRLAIRLPFDPSAEWGDRERHDVSGTINGGKVRGPLTSVGDVHYLDLRPGWCRDRGVRVGGSVAVSLTLEPPHIASVASDFAAALNAEAEARRFFESLPTFYRKNYVRWIEEAKRPDTRAKRILDAVAELKAGKRR